LYWLYNYLMPTVPYIIAERDNVHCIITIADGDNAEGVNDSTGEVIRRYAGTLRGHSTRAAKWKWKILRWNWKWKWKRLLPMERSAENIPWACRRPETPDCWGDIRAAIQLESLKGYRS
jgi:hypothetical protein